jgi:hypothetical protein
MRRLAMRYDECVRCPHYLYERDTKDEWCDFDWKCPWYWGYDDEEDEEDESEGRE